LQAGGRRFNPVRLHQRFWRVRGWGFGRIGEDEIGHLTCLGREDDVLAGLLFDIVKRVLDASSIEAAPRKTQVLS
jgi:hypothetical protein